MQVQQCTTLPQPVRPRFTPPASTLSPSFSRDLKSIKIAQFDSSKVLENGRWYFFGDVFPWRGGKCNRNWRNFAAIGFSTLRAFCHMYDFLSQTCICCIFNQSQGQFIYFFSWFPLSWWWYSKSAQPPWQNSTLQSSQTLTKKYQATFKVLIYNFIPCQKITKPRCSTNPIESFYNTTLALARSFHLRSNNFVSKKSFIIHLCSLGSLVFQGK